MDVRDRPAISTNMKNIFLTTVFTLGFLYTKFQRIGESGRTASLLYEATAVPKTNV
jgi:hypothetical protein